MITTLMLLIKLKKLMTSATNILELCICCVPLHKGHKGVYVKKAMPHGGKSTHKGLHDWKN